MAAERGRPTHRGVALVAFSISVVLLFAALLLVGEAPWASIVGDCLAGSAMVVGIYRWRLARQAGR